MAAKCGNHREQNLNIKSNLIRKRHKPGAAVVPAGLVPPRVNGLEATPEVPVAGVVAAGASGFLAPNKPPPSNPPAGAVEGDAPAAGVLPASPPNLEKSDGPPRVRKW